MRTQVFELCYKNRNRKITELSMSVAYAVIAIKDKKYQRNCSNAPSVLVHMPHKALLATVSMFLSEPSTLDSIVQGICCITFL
jgi:hypothetical protein